MHAMIYEEIDISTGDCNEDAQMLVPSKTLKVKGQSLLAPERWR